MLSGKGLVRLNTLCGAGRFLDWGLGLFTALDWAFCQRSQLPNMQFRLVRSLRSSFCRLHSEIASPRCIPSAMKLLHALIAQSQMLNDETERRAKAEESLRIELQGRVTLFSDAAHHLNNPLNHIDGAKRSIRRQSHELESVVMELINDDDGVEEVQTYLKERFENIRRADHVIENAVLRTARVVETLRAVSGVDGVGYEKASVVKVLNVALERLEAILGRDGAASKHLVFGTNLDELEQVESHRSAVALWFSA